MKLIGMLDSPYVRRVAISLKYLGVPFEHQPLSVFRNFAEFSQINPLVKAPTLICDDGEMLIDSTLILEHIEELAGSDRRLTPESSALRQRSRQLTGIALAACEKTVQILYERTLRPTEKQHQPWLDRVEQQLTSAYNWLEKSAAQTTSWLLNDQLTQADITVCVAWRFTQYIIPDVIDPTRYPELTKLSGRAEKLPEFASTPLD